MVEVILIGRFYEGMGRSRFAPYEHRVEASVLSMHAAHAYVNEAREGNAYILRNTNTGNEYMRRKV